MDNFDAWEDDGFDRAETAMADEAREAHVLSYPSNCQPLVRDALEGCDYAFAGAVDEDGAPEVWVELDPEAIRLARQAVWAAARAVRDGGKAPRRMTRQSVRIQRSGRGRRTPSKRVTKTCATRGSPDDRPSRETSSSRLPAPRRAQLWSQPVAVSTGGGA